MGHKFLYISWTYKRYYKSNIRAGKKQCSYAAVISKYAQDSLHGVATMPKEILNYEKKQTHES
jgi:hypothetical protein